MLTPTWRWVGVGTVAFFLAVVDAAAAQWPALGDEPIVRIGTLDGPVEALFAWIGAVDLDSRGNVYVLDTRSSRVARFGPDGAFLEEIGRPGQGPGEWRELWSLAVDTADRLHVVDPGNVRISVYDVSRARARHVGDERLPAPARRSTSICASEGRRFVKAYGPRILHEILPEGADVKSFGEPVAPPPELVREFGDSEPFQLSSGSITCDRGHLLYVSRIAGEVGLYTLDGELVWRRDVPAFIRSRIFRAMGMCCAFSRNPETKSHHRGFGGVIGEGEVRVMLMETSEVPGSRDLHYRYEERVLRLSDGEFLGGAEVPAVIVIRHDTLAVGYVQDPYPQVLVWRRAAPGDDAPAASGKRRQ